MLVRGNPSTPYSGALKGVFLTVRGSSIQTWAGASRLARLCYIQTQEGGGNSLVQGKGVLPLEPSGKLEKTGQKMPVRMGLHAPCSNCGERQPAFPGAGTRRMKPQWCLPQGTVSHTSFELWGSNLTSPELEQGVQSPVLREEAKGGFLCASFKLRERQSAFSGAGMKRAKLHSQGRHQWQLPQGQGACTLTTPQLLGRLTVFPGQAAALSELCS